jgi:hypothetical protein
VQCAFDLVHPEVHRALDPVRHFHHNCVNQRVCSYNTSHEITPPF